MYSFIRSVLKLEGCRNAFRKELSQTVHRFSRPRGSGRLVLLDHLKKSGINDWKGERPIFPSLFLQKLVNISKLEQPWSKNFSFITGPRLETKRTRADSQHSGQERTWHLGCFQGVGGIRKILSSPRLLVAGGPTLPIGHGWQPCSELATTSSFVEAFCLLNSTS